jgi:hypothetical protein
MRTFISGPFVACALVEEVIEGAVLVAALTTIQFLRDIFAKAARGADRT